MDEGVGVEDPPNNPRQVLNQWLQRRQIMPDYGIRQAGVRNRGPPRFLCELRVPTFPYVAIGNSLNKKDAQTNAARDFLQFLIRSGQMQENEIPGQALQFVPTAQPASSFQQIAPPDGQGLFDQGGSEGQGSSYFGNRGRGGRGGGQHHNAYRRPDGQIPFDIMDARKLADAEDLDVNAAIHGNWTIENAKSRLHTYMQMNRIKADYKYSPMGPDHNRSFRAAMSFYVKELGRPIQATESGSTKQTASKSCALSLVRQLYHLGIIEAFSGTLKRPKENMMKPYEASVDPALMQKVHNILEENRITPVEIDEVLVSSGKDNEGNPLSVSLLPETEKSDVKYDASEAGQQGIVSWSPPQPNWNTWTNCNIDEGYMATASLEQLSSEFLESFKMHQQTDQHVQKMMETRSKLPVFHKRGEIMEAIGEHPVVLIKGATGSGKTTQVCQFILDDYLMSEQGAYCNVVVTQPRRISAISIAERVASERGEDLGQTVGYSVRFESCLPRPYASVLFCTVGVLLRKLEGGLRGVSHVIVDEIHERDVNTDFILIVLRDMLTLYPDLRVILMSATIDTKLFTEYFSSCPVVDIEGRNFPVDTFFLEDVVEMLRFEPSQTYLKRQKKKNSEDDEETVTISPSTSNSGASGGAGDRNMNILPPGSNYSPRTGQVMSQLSERDNNFEIMVALLQHIKTSGVPGSVLIFLPGWNIIFTAMKFLQEHPVFGSNSYVLLPLHSQLPREDQHRVFEPVQSHQTKIILSTNIAETSITIDDVVFVIDSCKAKVKLFTSHNNMTTFATVWASKSNAMQRTGRAGRVQRGVCYRLCSRARYEALEENMLPEMLRTPLHEIALSIKLLRLGGIGHFLGKAPDPPAIDAVIEAQVLLTELKCLDQNSDLTPLGRVLARLPVDPRLGKMIILGTVFNCADPLAILAAQSANLSEVFILGLENRRLSGTQRAFAAYKFSDHFAILNAFQQWDSKRQRGEQEEMEFCNQRQLSFPSLRITSDSRNQLLQVLLQSGFPEEQLLPQRINFRDTSPVLDIIASLLCSGVYPNVCYHVEKRKVLTTESKAALVHKASVNCNKFEQVIFPYPFFVFGEKIRTRAVACKTMTMVSPADLLIFGSKKVEFTQGFVRLDNWINLQMIVKDAAAIVALRPLIENLVTRAVENPEGFFPLQDSDAQLVNVVTELSRKTYESQYQQQQANDRPPQYGQFGNMNAPEPYADDQGNFGEQQEEFQQGAGVGPRGVKRPLEQEPDTHQGSYEGEPDRKRANWFERKPDPDILFKTVGHQDPNSNPNPYPFPGAEIPIPTQRFRPPQSQYQNQGYNNYNYNQPRFGAGGYGFGGGRGQGGFRPQGQGGRGGFRVNASPHRGWSPHGGSRGGGFGGGRGRGFRGRGGGGPRY